MTNIIELRGGNNRKRGRIVRPYPLNSLKEAHELVETMYEVNSGLPVNRIMLAEAIGVAPSSSAYTTLLNSCSKFGLTNGNYRSSKIELTEFGSEFVQNMVTSNSRLLLKQAASKPEVFRQFYSYYENKKIPSGIDYAKISSLSNEAREKLSFVKPQTLGQASRVSGVTPADASVLAVLLTKRT